MVTKKDFLMNDHLTDALTYSKLLPGSTRHPGGLVRRLRVGRLAGGAMLETVVFMLPSTAALLVLAAHARFAAMKRLGATLLGSLA